jgi:hypothetical protein
VTSVPSTHQSISDTPLRTHSNASKPIPFIGLLHRSRHTPGWGSYPAAHHSSSVYPESSRKATIPFRIKFFAHPHHLTPSNQILTKTPGVGVPLIQPNPFVPFSILRPLTPIEFALTKSASLNPLDSAVTKKQGRVNMQLSKDILPMPLKPTYFGTSNAGLRRPVGRGCPNGGNHALGYNNVTKLEKGVGLLQRCFKVQKIRFSGALALNSRRCRQQAETWLGSGRLRLANHSLKWRAEGPTELAQLTFGGTARF